MPLFPQPPATVEIAFPMTATLRFSELLCAEKQWNAAVAFLEEYLKRFQKRVVPVRLRLAQILIEQQQRPSYAARS